jgi:hypothetical protein
MPEVNVNPEPPVQEPQEDKQAAKPELRKDVEYKLPDGRVLKMGKPSTPTHLLLPDLAASYNELAKGKADPVSLRLNLNFATMIAFVRSFNNEPFAAPRSAGEVIHIMNKLGEDGCDAVSEIYARHFAPLTLENLEIVKK